MLKKMTVVALFVVAMLASTTLAGVYTISPALNWSDGINPADSGAIAIVGEFWTTEWRNFEKYNITVPAGEVITNVMANVQVKTSSNGGWNAGVYLDLRDNNWDTGANKPLYADVVIAGTRKENRAPYASLGPAPDYTPGAGDEVLTMISTDITSYVSELGKTAGETISIRFGREIPIQTVPNGHRGASLGYSTNYNGVQLTITTEPVPEPASMLLLGLGGLATLLRRKK